MNKILLYANGKGWVLAWFKGPHAEQVRQLFGTDTLPTPHAFDSGMAQRDVDARAGRILDDIQRLNPGCFVEWLRSPGGL